MVSKKEKKKVSNELKVNKIKDERIKEHSTQNFSKNVHEETFSHLKNENTNERLNNRYLLKESKNQTSLLSENIKHPTKGENTFERELNYRQMAAVVKENKEQLSRKTHHDENDIELIVSFWDSHSDQALTATDPQKGYCISRSFLSLMQKQTLELFQSVDFD